MSSPPAKPQGDGRALAGLGEPRYRLRVDQRDQRLIRSRRIAARIRLLSPAAPPNTVSPVSLSTTTPRSAASAIRTASSTATASRSWNASRSDQARSASSSASVSASLRSPSVTVIAAYPPSATSTQGCIGKVGAASTF